MDIEYLQTLWQKEQQPLRYTLDETALRRLVQTEGRRFEKSLRHRDWFELLGGLVMGTFFLLGAFVIFPAEQGTHWIDHWDWILLALGCFLIGALFTRLRMLARAYVEEPGDSLLEALAKRQKSLAHRIRLLKHLVWWYVMPVAIPMAIVVVRSFSAGDQIRFTVVCSLSFVAVVWYNRWVARRRLQPQLNSVNELIEEARSGERDAGDSAGGPD